MAAPSKSLSTLDAVAMIVGIVIGAGIFRMPPLVASNVDGASTFLAVWLAGGVISLIGALCYAELGTTYPNTGGDYHFLMRAFGQPTSFLFGWARMTVIQPGAIALLGFVAGDYVANAIFDSQAAPTQRDLASATCAAAVVVVLTLVNMAGVHQGRWTQQVLTLLVVLGLLLIIVAGSFVYFQGGPPTTSAGEPVASALGMSMIFVLFTYSGWNEAAYLSAEMKGGNRSIVLGLVLGIVTVTFMYLLTNLAYVAALGIEGVRSSEAVAADTLGAAWGEAGSLFITVILVVAAMSTANGTVFTGGRSNYALGRDFSLFRLLGSWNEQTGSPRPALVVQGLIALILVAAGAYSRQGVQSMVEYTSPVFWFFFLLVGIAFFVLRFKDADVERPFRVPLYPVLPAIFCCASAYLLYSSVAYYQRAALVGVGVLIAGIPLMIVACLKQRGPAGGAEVAPLAGSANTDED